MDKRLVISDSSPIMSLAIIGQLRLIQELFGKIIIPKEVWDELIIEGKGKPGTNEIEKAKWIKVAKVKNDSLFKTLSKDLDVGESPLRPLHWQSKERRTSFCWMRPTLVISLSFMASQKQEL
jgi:predicted nucleic acid-binding protein